MLQQESNLVTPGDEQMQEAGTGNASNPSPQKGDAESSDDNQLLNKKAEKYLREAGNIEDVPDAQDQQEMDDEIKNNT